MLRFMYQTVMKLKISNNKKRTLTSSFFLYKIFRKIYSAKAAPEAVTDLSIYNRTFISL